MTAGVFCIEVFEIKNYLTSCYLFLNVLRFNKSLWVAACRGVNKKNKKVLDSLLVNRILVKAIWR